jgi:beta-mannosidase
MDLSGTWRAAPASDERRRSGLGLDADDHHWSEVQVPGHWRDEADFAFSNEPLLYRKQFTAPPPQPGERRFVVLDGVFYQADVWLDGAYLGDAEGYFFPHSYDITALSRLGHDHVLAIEVDCRPPSDLTAKRAITGVFQHWDCLDPDDNAGGLWRPVRLETTGPVRLDRLRVLCRDASNDNAHVRLHGRFDSDEARRVRIVTRVDGTVVAESERSLAGGMNEVDWSVDIAEPRLWWPWSLGEPALTEIDVSVLVSDAVSDRRSVRTGLRQVGWSNWTLSVNGERLFVKGANLGPTRAHLALATPGELERDVVLARDAGLDLIRLHAHITRPEVYEAADALGMLIWQDFPLQWGYARSVRRQAVRQAREAVDLLGHHPSIALWCCHNEPIALDISPGATPSPARVATRFMAGQQLPTWNRSVLDRWVKRAFETADSTRPVIAHSGVLPHLPQLDGTDSHLYFGWYHGDERDLPRFAATTPRLVRFVSEFGAQAVPHTADFMEPQRWPDLDWEHLTRHHSLQKRPFDRHVPPDRYGTFEQWRDATQRYQATVLKHHIETLRRLKYRPTGGFCLFSLTDAHPSVSWSVLDHERVPKLGYQAVMDACRPVIVVADRLPSEVTPGRRLDLDVHVVSDLRHPIDGAEVTAQLSWPGGSRQWRFAGDIPADACIRVGKLRWTVPTDAYGQLTLRLELVAHDTTVTNDDTASIRPGTVPYGS